MDRIFCKLCGEELSSKQEIKKGVCMNCDTTLIYDEFEGGQL